MDKQKFLEKYVVDRHGTCSAKWDGMQGKFGDSDLISMWIADMEFKTCDAITDALMERAGMGFSATALCRMSIIRRFPTGWKPGIISR